MQLVTGNAVFKTVRSRLAPPASFIGLVADGEADDERFVDNLIGTIDIGAGLEDATRDQALRVLPQAWWGSSYGGARRSSPDFSAHTGRRALIDIARFGTAT